MLESLKQEVFKANLDLVKHGLVLLTWGNASAYDAQTGYVVIKPSGMAYDVMQADDMVVVDLEGKKVEGILNQSSDTLTHIELYKNFDGIKSVVHTHSRWATIWAQACMDIPVLGTTHADSFYGDIPCTSLLSNAQIEGDYEKETGSVIIQTFKQRGISPLEVGAVIVANHGPFAWGKSCEKALESAIVMEYAAQMAYATLQLNPNASMPRTLIERHYLRKHGDSAYYGQ